MKILIVGVNYSPEVTGIAPYTAGLAEGLVRSGDQVHVITGIPHYPQWENVGGFAGLRRHEKIGEVWVTRVRHYIGSGGRGAGRVLHELTFGILAALCRWGRPDVVICVSPALISTAIIVAKARLLGIPVGVWVQDLYGNGFREIDHPGLGARALSSLEVATFKASSGIIVIHDRFRRHLVDDVGLDPKRVTVSRNWNHLRSSIGQSQPSSIRRRLFGDAPLVAVHTGNMGAKQDLLNIVEAARLSTSERNPVAFGLVGDGSQRSVLERAGDGIRNLVFVPPLDEEDYEAVLSCADVLIVNEKAGLRETAVPSKLTSYFARGRPVVAVTEADSATADEVLTAGAGVMVPPGQPAALLQAIHDVVAEPEGARRLGEAGVRFAQEHLSEESAVRRMTSWCAGLASPRVSSNVVTAVDRSS